MSGSAAVQLPLGLVLREGARFENYVPGGNAGALAAVRGLAQGAAERVVFLAGPPACGKTHLLQAAARRGSEGARGAAYVPLRARGALDPGLLAGLEHLGLVCLDDVDAVAGDGRWEEALFHLHNRLDAARVPLLLAARPAPGGVPWRLPDLASRWRAAPVFGLAHLDEAGCRAALQGHARARGIRIPDEVADYVLRRARRDMHSLTALLDQIDRHTLAAQRRVTVPLVRALLGEPQR